MKIYSNILISVIILFPLKNIKSQITFNGAAMTATSGPCGAGKFKKTNSANTATLELTTSSFTNGAIWACDASSLDLDKSFKLTFLANFGTNTFTGDGIVFVMETEKIPPGIIGGRGGGIGYAMGDGSNCQGNYTSGDPADCNIDPSVAVEFDTWDNTTVTCNDLPVHHTAIHRRGLMSTTYTLAGPIEMIVGGTGVVDGANHSICITWDVAIPQMKVWFDGVLRLTYNGDIRTQFGANKNTVYWGFTSATGGSDQTHKISSVVMDNRATVVSPTCAVVLPVQIVSFSAKTVKRVNELVWVMNEVDDINHFILEKSDDGENFSFLDQVSSSSYSTNEKGVKTYTYAENQFATNTYETYYRLIKVNNDGVQEQLGTVLLDTKDSNSTNVVKNPFEDICYLVLNSDKIASKTVVIRDLSGKTVYSEQVKVYAGRNDLNVDFKMYGDGVYFISIVDDYSISNFKVNKISK